MEFTDSIEAVEWLKPVTELIKSKNYTEASALTGWLPQTPECLSLKCTALMGAGELEACESLLERFPTDRVDIKMDVIRVAVRHFKYPQLARPIALNIIKSNPGMMEKLSGFLVQLINRKPYCPEIAELLLEMNPGNILPVTKRFRELYKIEKKEKYIFKNIELLYKTAISSTGHHREFNEALKICYPFIAKYLPSGPASTKAPVFRGLDFQRILPEIAGLVFKNLPGKGMTRGIPTVTKGGPGKSKSPREETLNVKNLEEAESIGEYIHRPWSPELPCDYDDSLPDPTTQSQSAGDDDPWTSSQTLRYPSEEYGKIQITRYTYVDFPTSCKLNEISLLRIQLLKHIPAMTRALEKIKVSVRKDVKNITLDVHVTAPGFKLTKARQPLTIEPGKDSEKITFGLTPQETGLHTIEIEFWYFGERVGYVTVKTEVTKFLKAGKKSRFFTMESPMEKLPFVRPEHKQRRTLHVGWSEKENKFSYTIYSNTASEFGEWEKEIKGNKDYIIDELRELNSHLTQVVSRGNPTDEVWDGMLINLKGFGTHLFSNILPARVMSIVRQWEKDTTLVISTNEQWVPWELLFDGEEFFGRKFIIARYPRMPDRKNPPDADRKPGVEQGKCRTLEAVVNVVGGDISGGISQKAASLFKQFPINIPVTVLEKANVSVVEKESENCNGLHFTCHGHLSPPMLQVAEDKTGVKNLLLRSVQTFKLKPGSIAFANACSSCAPVIIFGSFSNFGWEFYKIGCDIFIGALGTVPEKYAVKFAESVYRILFTSPPGENVTIGQAIARAKREAEKERNLFWLLYALYGDPDIYIKTKNPNIKKSKKE